MGRGLFSVGKRLFLDRRFLAICLVFLTTLLMLKPECPMKISGTTSYYGNKTSYIFEVDETKITSNTKSADGTPNLGDKVGIGTRENDKGTHEILSAGPKDLKRDITDGSNFEPYCAVHSSSFKYLIWPDSPSDLSDWTYKHKRKCPEFIVPDNMNETKRVKYSLNCGQNRPKLKPSITNKSNDVQVISMNNPCLAKFISTCCNDTKTIPNIVHYVWYFKKEMQFYMFVSMISFIRYVKPCLILFHGAFLPSGKYWDYIINIYPNILHVKRQRHRRIFGKTLKHHEHSGDIMRMEALMQLGGMYFDTDVIVLRDLEPLREFEVTLCRQSTGFLLNSFIMAKKNATFLKLWMEGYRKSYRNGSYVYNSMVFNSRLANKRPDLIHVENGTLCSPPALIGKNKYSDLIYDWSKLYGYHIFARSISRPWSEIWIKHYNLTVGAMVRHVIYGNKELCEGPVHINMNNAKSAKP